MPGTPTCSTISAPGNNTYSTYTLANLTIETGTGTNDTINIGGGEECTVTDAVIHTGAGNDAVTVTNFDWDDIDGASSATVDFGAGTGSGNGLGLGNSLTVGGGATVTLAQTRGSGQMIVVDTINVTNSYSYFILIGGGTLIVSDPVTAGDINVQSAGTVSVEAPLTVAASASTSGTFTVDGTIEFTGTSAPSSVQQFAISGALIDSVGVVTVDSAADVTVLTSSVIGSLSIPGTGQLTLQERSASPSSSGARALAVGSLDLGSTPSGYLDLKDNDLIVDYSASSPYSSIKSWLTSGYNNRAWTGNGIMSSAVVSSPHHTTLGYAEATDTALSLPATIGGQTLDDTAVLVKYTYEGDANLDGQVDIVDYGRLATSWQTSGDWYQADIDYSGFVDITDLGQLVSNWQVGVGNPLRGQQDPQQSFLDAIATLGLSDEEISDLLSMLNQDSGPAL